MLLDCVATYVDSTGRAGSAWQHSAEPRQWQSCNFENLWSARSSRKGVSKNNMKLKLETLQGAEGKRLRW
jgi:hypothetical protein